MKLKTWILWLVAGICFIFLGVTKIIETNNFSGVVFIVLGGFYIFLSIDNYRRDKKYNKNELLEEVLENMNIELKKLILEGKKFKAIKKYRMVTGLGLKEAKEYIDLLSAEKDSVS